MKAETLFGCLVLLVVVMMAAWLGVLLAGIYAIAGAWGLVALVIFVWVGRAIGRYLNPLA